MKFNNTYGMFVHQFLLSPQSVSNGAVCLHKFRLLLYNILIININKFLQRGRVLIKVGAEPAQKKSRINREVR